MDRALALPTLDGRTRRPVSLMIAVTVLVGLGVAAVTEVRPTAASGSQLPGLATPPDYRAGGVTADDLAWLGRGAVPGAATRWADMVRYALVDLHQMGPPEGTDGGIAAGAGPQWAYAWPRDVAFAAVALARTGHAGEAADALEFLQRVQEEDGGFEARYLLDGMGTPDGRPRQSDGSGWALWALDQVSRSAPSPRGRAELLGAQRTLLDRATAFALRETRRAGGLPRPSPDYWEHRERQLTLGTAAPLLAGLQAAARMYRDLGETGRATTAGQAAERLERSVVRWFGPGGYQRYATSGGVDAAVCFLLAPIADVADRAPVVAAWQRYQTDARRAGGGLAPGAGWRDDGISWTPETALVALTAAHLGDRATAERWLAWLDDHRTAWGSLPEKVLPDGAPAGPAPLTWTAAAVVLTVLALGD